MDLSFKISSQLSSDVPDLFVRDSDTVSDPVMLEVALSGLNTMGIRALHSVMKSALFRIYVNHSTGVSLRYR